MAEHGFGIRTPSLIEQLRAVLDQYPDDGQILKELIQNAEDARAKHVKFVNDRRQFSAESLYKPDLKNFQGPALYAYNDATFGDADWDRIGAIHNSSKKDDPLKVGKFGLGFKSVFHMTDLPSVISGDKIGFLDPHERFFGSRTTGKQWHLKKDRQTISTLSDQFEPFMGIFECSKKTFSDGFYNGTLFRFPLRAKEQNDEFFSELSEETYAPEKINSLFKSFMTCSYMNLLFLSSLETIELYERGEEDEKPRLIFSLVIDKIDAVRSERQKFLTKIDQLRQTNKWPENAVQVTYELQFTETKYMRGSARASPSHLNVANLSHDITFPTSVSTSKWMLTNHFSGGQVSARFKELANDSKLGFLPWVAVAMCCETKGEPFEQVKQRPQQPKGHLFCFLPLPLETKSITGLPVHVNGFFALSQNRRHLKWPTADQEKSTLTDKALLWNICLMEEAVSKAYAELLSFATKKCISPVCFYDAMPAYSAIDPKFEEMVKSMYRLTLSSQLFHSPTAGVNSNQSFGTWEYASEVLFNDLCSKVDNDEDQITILNILRQSGAKVCTVPSHIEDALMRDNLAVAKIQPRNVRIALKKPSVSPYVDGLPYEKKMSLLKYILSDSSYEDMVGISLLPLADQSFAMFQASKSEEVYIPTKDHPKELLPGLSHNLLDTSRDVPSEVTSHLKKIASLGLTQLKILDRTSVSNLIRRLFPLSKENCKLWNPQAREHPTFHWFQMLWKYLARQFPDDLSRFEGLHILPDVASCKVVRLSSGIAALIASWRGDKLDDSLAHQIRALGVIVFQNLPKFIEDHQAVVPRYISPPTPQGVLQALSSVQTQALAVVKDWPLAEKDKLRMFLSKASANCIHLHRELLLKLPIFRLVSGTKYFDLPSSADTVSLSEVQRALQHSPSFPLPFKFINASERDSEVLVQHLQIRVFHTNDLLKEIVLPNIEWYKKNGEIDCLMKQVLTINMNEDQKIFQKMKNISFIPTKSGMRFTANSLFDPCDHVVFELFDGVCDVFPTKQYRDEPRLFTALKMLGLKTKKDITARDIYGVAQYIQKANGPVVPDHFIAKSKAVMTILKSQPVILGLASEWLKTVKFIKVKPRPYNYPRTLPWCYAACIFLSPSELNSSIFEKVIGSVGHIAGEEVNEEIARNFGWNKRPAVSKVIDHLKQVVRHYTSKEKDVYLPMILDIYRELWHPERDGNLHEHLIPSAEKWIWNGDGFCSAEEVIPFIPSKLQGIQLKPHMFTLPGEVEEFSKYFTHYGVKPRNELEIILQVQSIIQSKYLKESSQSGRNSSKHTNLDRQRDLQTIIELLHIVESMDKDTLLQLQDVLLVPIHSDDSSSLILKPVSECTYCDMEWLQQGHDVTDVNDEESELIFFVHEYVPMQTSENLGIPTLMSRVLDAEELDINYGQSEPLTRRLHNLLKEGYTDGLSVPKELVQNADDAGATEVKFLFDQRENEDAQTCLIDDGMRRCQGPALWAYNDATFTEEDFTHIAMLGGATKEKMSDKVGKFGLGFNAVYNLTDVPSFISNDSIAIFDPHMKHLGRAVRSKPGMKINLKNRKKLQKLKNQFKPFNGIFGCNLDPTVESCIASYDATLFRFPLRTKEQSYESEISKVHYDEEEVKELLQMLVNYLPEVLLFTQNVKKVSIYHLPKNGTPSMMQPIYETTRNITKVIRGLHLPHLEPTQILRASTQVLQAVPSTHMNRVTQNPAVSLLLEMSSKKVPGNVGILKREERKDFWLVTSCLGDLTQEVLKMCKDTGLVPTGGVAVHLEECNIQGSKSYAPTCLEGTIFCYLPLPILSGFPFHVNGSFSVESNRKHLTEKTSDDKISKGAEWNETLFKDVISKAFLFCLEDLKTLTSGTSYTFCDLWPASVTRYKPVCQHFVKKLYATLFSSKEQQAPHLLSNGKMWSNAHSVGLLQEDIKGSGIAKQAKEVLEIFLQKEGKIYVEVPHKTMEALSLYAPKVVVEKIMYGLHKLYKEAVFPNLNIIAEDVRNALILHALDHGDKDLNELLHCACIPSLPHGQLKRPCDLLHPNGRAAPLYHVEDGKFIQGTESSYLHPYRLLVLEKLGICKDKIDCKLILERARSVAVLHRAGDSRGIERSKRILQYLEWRLRTCKTDKLKSKLGELREIPFLPAKAKPEGYPLPWKGNHNNLVAPVECFSTDVEDLVSSTAAVIDTRELKMEKRVAVFLQIKSERDVKVEQVWHQLDQAIKAATVCKYLPTYLMRHIYQHLNDLLKNNPKHQKTFTSELERRNAVYIPQIHEFISGRKVIFHSEAKFEPLLYELPSPWESFYVIMRAAGVRKNFDVADYIKVLQELHKDNHTFKKESLPSYVVQVVFALQEKISPPIQTDVPLTTTLKSVEVEHGPIYLPDDQGVMSEAKQLCFDDCQWLENDDSTHYVHKDLPYHVAIGLGVQTKRGEKLRKYSMGIGFGQKEKLTNRIKRILDGYPYDQDILKELLQNADDAKATEIHFVFDPRQHPVELIFEECWEPLQGPALCVYNNSPFTEADIKGIQNLGEGSKSEDPNKTGQYGVGFNAVYHLTDAPSFLTKGEEMGETLCVFDPHCIYVPGASDAEPGRRYVDIPKLRRSFPDVFAGYLDDMRDIFPMEEATLFRLPLRNEYMARRSQIKQKAVTTEEMQSLMRRFKDDLFLMMLFLNNIKKISLSEIDTSTGKLQNTYSVEAHLSAEDTQAQQSFQQKIMKSRQILEAREMRVDQLHAIDVSYKLSLQNSEGRSQKWLITQQFGFSNSAVSPTLQKALGNRELGLLPRGGTAFLLQSDIPRLEISKPQKNIIFCFLPLPLETDLPVHINGHFALDHEARRNLWVGSENMCTDVKSEWNKTLLEQTVAPCYTNQLEQTKLMIMENIHGKTEAQIEKLLQWYAQLFPIISHKERYIHYLAKRVYQLTCELSLRVLPVLRRSDRRQRDCEITWFQPTGSGKDEVFFDDLDSQILEPKPLFTDIPSVYKPSPSCTVRRILLDSNFNLVHCPMSIFRRYGDAGIQVKTVSPESVLQFFQTFQKPEELCFISEQYFPVDITNTIFGTPENLQTVLEFCTKSSNFLQMLEDCPLLLTQDKKLKVFSSRSPVFCSKFSYLLPMHAAFFCHTLLVNTIFCTFTEKSQIFKRFMISDLAASLPSVLPQELHRGGIIHWNPEAPSKQWIQSLWKYLHSEVDPEVSNETDAVSKCQKIRDLLKPLSDWCLLPVIIQQSSGKPAGLCLLQMSRAQEAVDSRVYFSGFEKILDVLQKLDVPQLAYALLQGHSKPICPTARATVSNINSPISVVAALEGVAKRQKLVGKANVVECQVILGYFRQCLDVLKKTPELKSKVCSFPFFYSVTKELISIERKTAYIIPTSIPAHGMQVWDRGGESVAFLRPSEMLEPLYKWLGCQVLSECDAYCMYIFPKFADFSEAERVHHLEFIIGRYLHPLRKKEDDRKRMIKALSCLKFLPNSRIPGTLATASSFYDPCNEVFKAMLTEKEFPPYPYNSTEFLPLLREIGLQQHVTAEKVIEFAKSIEKGSRLAHQEQYRTFAEQARVVVEHLLSRKDVLSEYSLLHEIRDVPFLPQHVASENLQRLCPQGSKVKGSVPPFICFSGSIPYKQEYELLSWTNAHFIEQWANPMSYRYHLQVRGDEQSYYRKVCEALGVKEKPSTEQVVGHCCSVCHSLQEQVENLRDKEYELLCKIMGQMYQWLEKDWKQLNEKKSPKWTKQLQNLTCILVEDGRRLVYPNQVAIFCLPEDELKPYLYAVPPLYAMYKDLFKLIGSTDRPSCYQYANVLEMIHRDTEGEKLEPNEKKNALKAMGFLFKKLRKPEQLNQLYLLTSNGDLQLSKDIIYYNKMSHFERLQKVQFDEPVLVSLTECEFEDPPPPYSHVAEYLPQNLRLRNLTDVVKEKLMFEPEFEDFGEHPVQLKMRSPSFCQAVIRLLRHAGKEENFQVNEEDIIVLKENIKNIKFHLVPELTTVLEYKGDVLEGSEKTQFCFYRMAHCGQQSYCFYLKRGVQISKNSHKIAGVLNTLSKHRLSSVFHQLCCILYENVAINGISKCLDELDILPDESNMESVLPTPGTYLHIDDQYLLSEDFDHFERGEYVGYEVEDPLLKNLEGLPTYIYAIVLEEIIKDANSQTSNVQRKYKISIGSEENDILVVSANDLYKFKRPPKKVSKDILPYEKSPYEVNSAPELLEDILQDITRTLEKAWKLDENERKKIIKRLIRKYHPDKNLGQEDTYNKACQFIQSEVARLDRGPQQTFAASRPHSAYTDIFSQFYTNMGRRARHERDCYHRFYSGGSSRSYGSYSGGSYTRKNPQPTEAFRWFCQSQWDFKAVTNDTSVPTQSYEWACFKCHQSAEKALKAAQFAIDANLKDNSHDLPSMAASLDLSGNGYEIAMLSSQLQTLLRHSVSMRYPDRCYSGIPHDEYKNDTATKAKSITEELLSLVKALLKDKGVPVDRDF